MAYTHSGIIFSNKNEILIPTTACMNLKHKLGKITQAPNGIYYYTDMEYLEEANS